MILLPPSPWLSGGTIAASSVLLPNQLLQTVSASTSIINNAGAPIAPAIGSNHIKSATDINIDTSGTRTNRNSTNADYEQSTVSLNAETSRPSSYIVSNT